VKVEVRVTGVLVERGADVVGTLEVKVTGVLVVRGAEVFVVEKLPYGAVTDEEENTEVDDGARTELVDELGTRELGLALVLVLKTEIELVEDRTVLDVVVFA
jgi:hypothetical protein